MSIPIEAHVFDRIHKAASKKRGLDVPQYPADYPMTLEVFVPLHGTNSIYGPHYAREHLVRTEPENMPKDGS